MYHSFDVYIAKKIGVYPAIILNYIYFWTEHNRANETNYYDGYYWTYNSIRAFEDLFPYLSKKQIRSSLEVLISEELIVKGNYNSSGYDRTTWYAITPFGKDIIEKGHMDLPYRENGIAPQGEPIPFNNQLTNNDSYNIPNELNEGNNDFNKTIPNSINKLKGKEQIGENNNVSHKLSDDIKEIVDYLNLVTGKNYKYKSNKTVDCIKARMNEGFVVDDFKKVIDIKTKQWLNDPKWNKFLRPETLFGNKFEGYLNEQITVEEEKPYSIIDDWMNA